MRPPEKVNILLVDDQPARLLTYQSVLSELGQNLVSARSGLEALEKLMRDEFAVVLLDVSMPEMDGFEAARLIHEHPRFERTPIIFVTGVHMSELDRLKGYKVGAVDYVSIPVVPEILRSKVAVLVELYCKRRELRALNRNLAEANERLAMANTALQAEKTRELEALNVSLQQANAELERANAALQAEVTVRSRAEDALRQADRHKDEFLAMLAHELRNPLAPIRNAVHLMRMKSLQDPQMCLARDVIERQLSQLTRLVDDLLDVSRITRGKINLTRQAAQGERIDRTCRGDRGADHPGALAGAHGGAARGAAGSGWRLPASDAGHRQRARQCREVHRHRRQHCAAGVRARTVTLKYACATRASAFPPRYCPRSSICSRSSTSGWSDRRVVWALAWRWCGAWWRCTAAA